MPIYDYSCSKCEHTFVAQKSIADRKQPESDPCPSCGAASCVTQQILTAPGLGTPIGLNLRKHDEGFKEIMTKIDKGVAGSQLRNSNSSIFN